MSSPDAFGAAAARGMQQMGQGLQQLGAGLTTWADKKRDEDVANSVAQSDFTRRELELRNEVGADGAGYQNEVLREYDNYVEEQANMIEDDKARAEYKRRMMAQRPSVSSRAASYEFGTAAQYSEDRTNTSLVGLENRIRLQPDQFEELIAQGNEVIGAATSIPATAKAGAQTAWTQKATQSYFEGRLDAAQDVHDIDAVLADLENEEWSSRLSSAGLERILSMGKTGRSAIQTKADADARAAVEFLGGRATDVTMLIPPEEIASAQALVDQSANPITQSRMARIARDQEILKEMRGLSPDQQKAVINSAPPVRSLPPRVALAVTNAATWFGVSPTYLAGMAGAEYGGYLKGDPDAIDYGKGNADGASSAVGIGQIVNGTMIELAQDPGLQAVVMQKMGIDLTSMSKDEILALRSNPEVSMAFSAAYAAKNARALTAVLGRPPNDGELYMAHFMGTGGASRFLRTYKTNPDLNAAEMFPEAAASNPKIYYKKDGSARTIGEVYQILGAKVGTTASYVEYGDAQTRENAYNQTTKAVNDDPMNHAGRVGNVFLTDVNTPEGMAKRGQDARSVADYYNIPYDDMKPFTKEEASSISKQLADGDADEALAVLAQVQSLGGAMARAGLKQISEMNEVYGYAGGLASEGGGAVAASEVVRGQKRIEENPDIIKSIGVTDADLANSFYNVTGDALFGIAPKERQNIYDAAVAHYVETKVARGGAGAFDEAAFAASINAVMGAPSGGAVVDEVNGTKVALPPGVTGDLVETAMEAMTVADWTVMSEQRTPPRYADGSVAQPSDLAANATLQTIGANKYRVMMDDGSYLVTGNAGPGGRAEAFIFTPTADSLTAVAERGVADTASADANVEYENQTGVAPGATPEDMYGPTNAQRKAIFDAMADGNLTQEEQEALIAKYGEMWAYDSDGNRIVP